MLDRGCCCCYYIQYDEKLQPAYQRDHIDLINTLPTLQYNPALNHKLKYFHQSAHTNAAKLSWNLTTVL